jgi:hypothetical protein
VAKRGFLIFFFLFIGCRRIYHPSALLLLPPPSLYPRPASWEIVVEGGGQFGRGYYLGERFRAGMGEVVASRSGESFSFRGGGGAFGGKYDSLASTGGSFSSYGGRLFFEGEIHNIRRPEGFIVSAGIYLQVSREGGEYLERLCNSAFCPEENPPKRGEETRRTHRNLVTPWFLGKLSFIYTGKVGEDLLRLDLYLPFYPMYLIPIIYPIFPLPHPGFYPVLTFRPLPWFFLSAGYPLTFKGGVILWNF